MARSDSDHPHTLIDDIKNVFDTKPQAGTDGIGPTLGQDLRSTPGAERGPANEQQDPRTAHAAAEIPAATGGANAPAGAPHQTPERR